MVEIKSKEKIIERINKVRKEHGSNPLKLGIEIKNKPRSLNQIKTIKDEYPFSLKDSKLTYKKKQNVYKL